MTTDRTTPHEDADIVSRELASALRMLGLGLPETEAEVAAAEAWLAKHPVKLRESLRDLESVFRRSTAGKVLNFRSSGAPAAREAAENLARAAREGKTIPEDIEHRMREDRERAERERKDE